MSPNDLEIFLHLCKGKVYRKDVGQWIYDDVLVVGYNGERWIVKDILEGKPDRRVLNYYRDAVSRNRLEGPWRPVHPPWWTETEFGGGELLPVSFRVIEGVKVEGDANVLCRGIGKQLRQVLPDAVGVFGVGCVLCSPEEYVDRPVGGGSSFFGDEVIESHSISLPEERWY